MNLARGVAYVGGRTGDGRAQAAGADGRRGLVGVGGAGGGGQADIAMSRQRRGLHTTLFHHKCGSKQNIHN